jgi:regulatory protein YycI of two-component signal transduction system YycFG
MNKKIISIFFLLVLSVSVLVTYIYFNQTNQTSAEEKQGYSTTETITGDEITEEIDNSLLDEDGEIEIGEMV